MKKIIRPVKGTRDFYPEQMVFRQWLYNKMRAVSQRFGYQEYDGPILESLDLYASKSGEELVKEQSYVFKDRGNDQIVLRPELTPTLARMVAQKQNSLTKPIRWWSFGPFWRYERPQKGRTREFFQWNIDLIGVDSSYADVEIVTVLTEFFRSVGLTAQQVGIRVNNRKLIQEQLQTMEIANDKVENVYRLIDKVDKLSLQDWLSYGQDFVGLNDRELSLVRGMLENKGLWRQSKELVSFFSLISDMGINDFVEFDASIIRGLDYYTGFVFEVWDRQRDFRAILGGGRYENLVADVGGKPIGGVGFGMGDVVIGLVLEQYGIKPILSLSPAKVLVTVFSSDLISASNRIATRLRLSEINTELYPEPAKLDKQLKYANSLSIPLVVIIGPDETAKRWVKLKNLITGEQTNVEENELVKVILSIIESK